MKVADPYYLSKEWEALRLVALRAAGWRCAHCGAGVRGAKAGQSRPVVDHVVSRRKGGVDTLNNLEVLCLPCHNRKTAHVDYNVKEPVGLDGLPDSWR
jgi:5-methylcytosine-specific restriction protein A